MAVQMIGSYLVLSIGEGIIRSITESSLEREGHYWSLERIFSFHFDTMPLPFQQHEHLSDPPCFLALQTP